MKQYYHLILSVALWLGAVCTSGILSLILLVIQWLLLIDHGVALFKNDDVMDSYLHRWLNRWLK